MIASLHGRLLRRTDQFVVIDVGGVGYRVFVSRDVIERIGAQGGLVTLDIHTQVKEDSISLYGFLDNEEQEAFEALIAMNGVGPRLAMGVLSSINAHELAVAVCSADIARLCLIPGIGKKKAERMIVELKDRLMNLAQAQTLAGQVSSTTLQDLRSALSNLGFKGIEVEHVISALRDKVIAGQSLDDLLPEALKLLRG